MGWSSITHSVLLFVWSGKGSAYLFYTGLSLIFTIFSDAVVMTTEVEGCAESEETGQRCNNTVCTGHSPVDLLVTLMN